MSLLDEARRLAEQVDPIHVDSGHCFECEGWDQHLNDCPWLAMPRIVAALEAAQRLLQSEPHDTDRAPFVGWYIEGEYIESRCYWCGDRRNERHDDPECPWLALVAAMGAKS